MYHIVLLNSLTLTFLVFGTKFPNWAQFKIMSKEKAFKCAFSFNIFVWTLGVGHIKFTADGANSPVVTKTDEEGGMRWYHWKGTTQISRQQKCFKKHDVNMIFFLLSYTILFLYSGLWMFHLNNDYPQRLFLLHYVTFCFYDTPKF